MGLIQSIQAHPTMWALGAWYVFSAAVSSLPMPKPDAPDVYSWLFAFLHTLSGSIGRVMAMKYQQGAVDVPAVQIQTVHPTSDGGVQVTTTQTGGK